MGVATVEHPPGDFWLDRKRLNVGFETTLRHWLSPRTRERGKDSCPNL